MAEQSQLKRTKILATVGPASSEPERLEMLIRAGANGLRLNMSHGSHEEHGGRIADIRRISDKLSKPLAIVADLQGPKIRLGNLPEAGLELHGGKMVSLSHGDHYTPDGPLPVQYDITKYVKPGESLFLRDGMVAVAVETVSGGVISGKILNSGTVFSKQGINLPDTDLGGDILTEKDVADLRFAVEQGADYVALSFVQTADDVRDLRRRLEELGGDCGVIAKIETKAAAGCLEEIIKVSDGVMVARGDLAIETSPESVPVVQKQIIDIARTHQKLAIVATQMLESMIYSPQPTRAEVSDVATAVVQGADAVMLSGESAVGKYPVETVALMKRVIVHTEANRFESITAQSFGGHTQPNAISAAAITLAKQIDSEVIIAETSSGQTVRNLSSYRPEAWVVGVTHNPRVFQQLALVWGVRSYLVTDPATATPEVIEKLRREHQLEPGATVIRISGNNPGVAGGTDTLRLLVA